MHTRRQLEALAATGGLTALIAGGGCGPATIDHDRPCAPNVRYEDFGLNAEDAPSRLEALRGVTEVVGDIDISGDVSSLEALSCLSSVQGAVWLETNDLRSLDGLERLERVESLHLTHLWRLEDVDALAMLHTASDGISLEDLPVVEDLTGLSGLTDLHGVLYLRDLAADAPIAIPLPAQFDGSVVLEGEQLPDLRAMTATLRSISGNLHISGPVAGAAVDLSGLEQVDGTIGVYSDVPTPVPSFASLHTVTGGLALRGQQMADLTGLSALERVGELSISQSPNLTTLHGLEGLRRIVSSVPVEVAGTSGGGVHLDDDPMLVDISALAGVTELTSVEGQPGFVSLTDLPALTSLEGTGTFMQAAWLVSLTDLPALTDLHGWSGLQSVPQLAITRTGLVSFDGLSLAPNAAFGPDALVVEIRENATLSDIGPLVPQPGHAVPHEGAIFIVGSPQLGQCQAQAFVDAARARGFGGQVEQSGLLDDGPC